MRLISKLISLLPDFLFILSITLATHPSFLPPRSSLRCSNPATIALAIAALTSPVLAQITQDTAVVNLANTNGAPAHFGSSRHRAAMTGSHLLGLEWADEGRKMQRGGSSNLLPRNRLR